MTTDPQHPSEDDPVLAHAEHDLVSMAAFAKNRSLEMGPDR